MLGSYVVNLGLTAALAVGIVVALIVSSDLSVLEMQIAGVALAVGIPLFLYGYSQLFWISIDLLFNSPRKFDPNMRH